MDDAKEQAKEQFARFRGSMQPRISSLQGRLNTVPDRLQNIPDQLQDRLPKSFPRPSPQSPSRSDDPPPPPPLVPHPLQRAPLLADPSYNHDLAALAAKILYRSGRDPVSGGPLLVLCASAFPDANAVDYTVLLPYVLSNLPSDDELRGPEEGGVGDGYSVVFFAGGGGSGPGKSEGARPTWKWTLQAYTLVGVIREIAGKLHEETTDGTGQLGRAVRKKIRKLWIVHEKSWIRTILEIMAGVVSVKFKKKVVHLNTLSDLASHVDITKLNIPPAVYIYDRKIENQITLPGFPPPPVFGRAPFLNDSNPPRVGDNTPLPQVLVEASNFIRQSSMNLEGIFRVPPSQALLEIARECYDRRTSLQWEDWGPHTAAGLIKLYYRSLPEPMVPLTCYEQMMSLVATDPARRHSDEEEEGVRFEIVRALLTAEVAGLPLFSRILFLRHLLPLLSAIAAHSAENKMNPVNLAVCVGGSLVRSDDVAADARVSAGVRKFIEIGIQRIDELAPKLPLRRGGVDGEKRRNKASVSSVSDFDKRRSQASPYPEETPPPYTARPTVVRKRVPGLTMPRWENQGKDAVIVRKSLPSFDGTYDSSLSMSPVDGIPRKLPTKPEDSPLSMSPADGIPRKLPAKSEEPRRVSVPRGPRPPPPSAQSARSERASTYDAATTTTTAQPEIYKPQQPLPATATRPRTRSEYTPYHPPVPPAPKIFVAPSKTSPTHLAAPGTFTRPALRRVASANFPAAAATTTALSGGFGVADKAPPRPQVIRRARSQLIGGTGGPSAVRELRELFEERAKIAETERGRKKGAGAGAGAEVVRGRRYSSVGL